MAVSIHAPSWGAHIRIHDLRHSCAVSIHIPLWGVPLASTPTIKESMFQFTLPCGEHVTPNDRDQRSQPFQFTLPRGEHSLFLNKLYIRFRIIKSANLVFLDFLG